MTGDELEQWEREQADAQRRAQVQPMTCAVALAWLAAGVMLAVIVIGALWLMVRVG